MKTKKPILIIAGAGGGKTTNMVNEIIKRLPNLEPHRYLAAITYTNAATNSIKERLSKKIEIPPNVFIGTTYAFFNKFLVLPYATIFELTQSDKIFIELNLDKIAQQKMTGNSISDIINRNSYKKNLGDSLLAKGIIPFDKIAPLSVDLIKIKLIRERIGQKLQFLFIDEFQDANRNQFKVFEEIRKSKQTEMYMVGDPEQFITNFSSKYQKFASIPIIKHVSKFDVEKKNVNHRCSTQITTFINNFNTQLQQIAKFSTIESGVYFITKTDIENITEFYITDSEHWKAELNFRRFYLAYTNKQFDTVRNRLGLVKISNENTKTYNILQEVLQIIYKITALNQQKICEKYAINILQLRSYGIRLWKESFANVNDFKHFFEIDLKFKIENNLIDIKEHLTNLNKLKKVNNIVSNTEFTTTIHKSKGLEATCVLVIARTENELNEWIETDPAKRLVDKNDRKRLGFVAFSRAKMSIYIACLKPISNTTKSKLKTLNIVMK